MRNKILIIVLLCFSLFAVSALAPVSVEAAATMSPQFGVVGTYINVSGLTAGATYTIRWDGISLGSGVVPAGGTVLLLGHRRLIAGLIR